MTSPRDRAATAAHQRSPHPHPLVDVTALTTGYGQATALRDVALTVPQGAFVALIGRNGVGKTTLVRTMTGRHSAWTGQFRLDGVDATRWAPHRRARWGLRWVDEDRGLFPQLTVLENLQLGLFHSRSPDPTASLGSTLERFPRLRERSAQRAGSLSGGEQRMLALARALATGPRLLVLDEFSEGLQPSVVQELAAHISSANAEGLTVLLVEQNVRLALRLADHAYVLDKGSIVYDGPTAALQEDDRLLAEHLII